MQVAVRTCEKAAGVDPSPSILWLGRWLNVYRRQKDVNLSGTAEDLPLPNDRDDFEPTGAVCSGCSY